MSSSSSRTRFHHALNQLSTCSPWYSPSWPRFVIPQDEPVLLHQDIGCDLTRMEEDLTPNEPSSIRCPLYSPTAPHAEDQPHPVRISWDLPNALAAHNSLSQCTTYSWPTTISYTEPSSSYSPDSPAYSVASSSDSVHSPPSPPTDLVPVLTGPQLNLRPTKSIPWSTICLTALRRYIGNGGWRLGSYAARAGTPSKSTISGYHQLSPAGPLVLMLVLLVPWVSALACVGAKTNTNVKKSACSD